MRAFNVTIRQSGRVIRYAALGRCSCDVLSCCLACLDDTAPFSVCVRRVHHGQ